jgi:hypothetical protein
MGHEAIIPPPDTMSSTNAIRTLKLFQLLLRFCVMVMASIFRPNDERMHPYQRGRTSITGLRL